GLAYSTRMRLSANEIPAELSDNLLNCRSAPSEIKLPGLGMHATIEKIVGHFSSIVFIQPEINISLNACPVPTRFSLLGFQI
ncbi:MAG: hypothetical protein WKF30_01165, partial [Pyrinomonadaceae bacterium]